MQTNTAKNTIVLLGIGHTNAHIVKMWKMHPIPDAQLICVTNFPIATYSGMMPGALSEQYSPEEIEIDLVRLCASAGVRLVIAEVETVDHVQQRIRFANRPDLSYDFLSIGIGSRPSTANVTVIGDSLTAVKPMQTFLARLDDRIKSVQQRDDARPVQIAVVGGGLGSIEIAFCLRQRFSKLSTPDCHITLVGGKSGIGSALLESTRAKVDESLNAKGITAITGNRVSAIEESQIVLDNGDSLPADVVIWSTDASAPKLLERLDFEKDEKGFLLIRPTLQTLSSDRVFAVGDTGTLKSNPTDKAGVFAVRQGPVLWNNLQQAVKDASLTQYTPQRDYLKLINTGDGSTILQFKGRTFTGQWCWWLKDRIDQKFMAMYRKYDPPMMKMPSKSDTESAMRCLGCGGKIGGQVLSAVLAELEIPDHSAAIVGLANPDDAAVVRTTNNQVTVTNDFFASPFDDPYLVGRIALLNSASDCFVMGAQPSGVLAMVQLPLMHSKAQIQVMRELMAGSVEEINRMGGVIVGGHSIEGPRLTIGFTVLGDQVVDLRTKGMLKAGDKLVLTKPLGSGVMLAALMQAQLRGEFFQPLINMMLQSNQIALDLMQEAGVSGVTDVTGFGLAGHLKEMISASGVSAKLNFDDLPVLDGCQELIAAGIQSTLADDNRVLADGVLLKGSRWQQAPSAVLFDPQTSGGILMGVRESALSAVMEFLGDHGFEAASVIGEVVTSTGERPSIELV